MDNSKILDDLTRVAGGAFSVFSALGKQIQGNLKDQMGEKFSSGRTASSSDDVERLQGVVTKLRIEQEDLKSRIAELEAMLGKKAPAKKKAAAKPAAQSKAKAQPKAKAKTKASPAKTKKRA